MECSSSAELTGNRVLHQDRQTTIENSAIGTAPELTTLWWNAAPP
jgi:hypothetical protein